MNAAGIILSNLNDCTLSRLTEQRTVAAIPFACRYRLVDFVLSGMVNAGLQNISIVANYNYRSLAEHIGCGKDWDLARPWGGIRFLSPYQTSGSGDTPLHAHRMETLKSIAAYLREYKEEFVVLSDCTDICSIRLADVIRAHRNKDADLTLLTTPCPPSFTAKFPVLMMRADSDGKVLDMVKSTGYHPEYPQRFLSLFVFRTRYLNRVLDQALAYNHRSLTDDVLMKQTGEKKYYAYCHEGYAAFLSGFLDYYHHSIELTRNEAARQSLLFNRENPVYTSLQHTPPALYKEGAEVYDSLIADDCIIEGKVENSILFPGVRITRHATVRNSVLFAGTYVGQGSTLNCVVSDEEVVVSDHSQLSGSKHLPYYISRGCNV